jgi:hypothetical protein
MFHMLGLFGEKKLERGLTACRLVVPLMQGSRLMLRLAKDSAEFGLLRVAVCAAREKCCSMRQHPMRENKIPNALRDEQALSLVRQHHPPFENRRKNDNA